MKKGIILRYGELHLKGKNRGFFEKKLVDDIKYKLRGFDCKLSVQRGRYLISGFDEDLTDTIIQRCKQIFGLHSLSVAHVVKSDFSEIMTACCDVAAEKKGSFRVSANRADKRFPYNSMQLCMEGGGHILQCNPQLSVDLHNPDFVVRIDVREEGHTFVFEGSQPCAGGMPLGTSGKGLLLLSGGLDSPVAGYLLLRRGLILDALHFHSYPYTNEMAQKKVEDLALKLSAYCGGIALHMLKLTEIQEKIRECCDPRFAVTVLRMLMMKISEMVAQKTDCKCLVNGESLGQVASQTLDSLVITDSMVTMPVFRPLIGADKQEIIEIAKKIDTYDTAILPYEDCCTVFLPKHPVTRPKMSEALFQMGKIKDLDGLIEKALQEMETKIIKL